MSGTSAPLSGDVSRAIPPAGARPRPGMRILRMCAVAVGALVAGSAVLGIRNSLTAGSPGQSREGVIAEIAGPEADAVLRALRQRHPPTPTRAEAQEEESDSADPPQPVQVLAEVQQHWIPPLPQPGAVEQSVGSAVRDRKRESRILVYQRGGTIDAPPQAAIAAGGEVTGFLYEGAGSETSDRSLAGRLRAAQFEAVSAEVLQDLDTRILEGTVIACILETAISSIVPGMTICRTRVPVYSEDGSFELIPAGSRVMGEYRGGIESGQARIFVLWRRLITPDGVSVALASPGAGPLGRGGHEGHLDQKWAERFASAVMVSLVASAGPETSDRAVNAAAAALGTVAAEAIRGALPAVPELVKQQGEPIAIIVARDLDFGAAMQMRFESAGRSTDVLLFGDS